MDPHSMRRRVMARLPAKGRSWYEIKNAAGSTAVVRVYDEIGYPVTADEFARDLEAISADQIEVHINSPGGDVFDGVAIYNALRAHPARITTRVDGIAASIASVVAQAGDHRVMLSGSQMMVHEAWGLAIGPASEMREYAALLDKQSDVIASIYAERSDRPESRFRQMMTDETWLTADETVAAGLADEIRKPARKEKPADANALYAQYIASVHGLNR